MENPETGPPKKWTHKLLVRAYRPANAGKSSLSGRSPLDVPQRTVIFSFLLALVAVLVAGNIYISFEHWCIGRDLRKIETREKPIPGVGADELPAAVIDRLLPDWKDKISEAEDSIRSALKSSFAEKKITVQAVADFAGNSIEASQLKKMIIGDIRRSWWTLKLIPYFDPLSPNEIADSIRLHKSYEGDSRSINSANWKRFIFVSSVQYLRDKLDNGISHPRRRLIALGGGIQWVTFTAAVWCLIMLLLLRMPWCRMQSYLNYHNRLPWHGDSLNVWNILSGYFGKLDDRRNYPGMFLPVRLIKDTINIKNSDPEASIYDVARERVEAYRNSVEIGEYEIINFLIWATPTFGFIGTIFGIILAMENAGAIFSAPTTVEQGIALDKVSGALGTAFDTSFIALIWLVPMSFFLARTRKAEANFFEELEHKAVGYLPPQFEQAEGENS